MKSPQQQPRAPARSRRTSLSLEQLTTELVARFGPLMSTQEAADVLKLSVPAMRMARQRKKLLLEPLEVEGRRGQLFAPADVARVLFEWLSRPTGEASPPEPEATASN